MAAPDREVAILFVPDPTSQSGWIRRKVFTDPEPLPVQPVRQMGFAAEVARRQEMLDPYDADEGEYDLDDD